MRIRFDFEINLKQLTSHKNWDSETVRKQARVDIKGKCQVCGSKITAPYRKKVCSPKCEAIMNKNRSHKKVIY